LPVVNGNLPPVGVVIQSFVPLRGTSFLAAFSSSFELPSFTFQLSAFNFQLIIHPKSAIQNHAIHRASIPHPGSSIQQHSFFLKLR